MQKTCPVEGGGFLHQDFGIMRYALLRSRLFVVMCSERCNGIGFTRECGWGALGMGAYGV